MKKRLLSLCLVFCLLFALLPVLPVGAYGDDDIAYPVTGGNIYFNKATGTVTDCDDTVTAAQIPEKIDGVTVTEIDRQAFFDRDSLIFVTLPATVTKIGTGAFNDCEALYGVFFRGDLPEISADAAPSSLPFRYIEGKQGFDSWTGNPTSVWDGETEAIDGVCRNETVYFHLDLTECALTVYGTGTFGAFDAQNNIPWQAYPHAIHSLVVKGTITSIGYRAFSCCTELRTAVLEEGVETIGEGAFYSIRTLTEVTIPESVTEIGTSAFSGCSALKTVHNAKGVQTIGESAFRETPLEEYPFSDVLSKLGSYAFDSCEQLETVKLPGTLTSIGPRAFAGCNNLRTVQFSEGLQEISDYAFENCALSSLDLPDSLTTVWRGAFSNNKLVTLDVPDGVTTIYENAFSDNLDLIAVKLGNKVTNLGAGAFIRCKNLKKVVLGSRVSNIENSAFSECSLENGVYCKGDAPEVGGYPFGKNYDITIYFIEGRSGWTTPRWNQYLTAPWDGTNLCTGGHSWDAGETLTAPTCTQDGTAKHTCIFCGESEKYTLKALGHDYQNGVCTRCGAQEPAQPVPAFTDVPANAWFAGAVDYAVEHELMNGMGNNEFQPNTSMTRAMLVTVLWRYAESPKQGENTFTDVPSGKYYTDAVAWAAANGIVNGVGDGKFNPDGNITREQLVTILYRYCQKLDLDTSKADDLTGFPDAGSVGNSAKDAMRWAVAEKLIGGKTLDASGTVYLQPKGSATRAEVATILMRFIENILKK